MMIPLVTNNKQEKQEEEAVEAVDEEATAAAAAAAAATATTTTTTTTTTVVAEKEKDGVDDFDGAVVRVTKRIRKLVQYFKMNQSYLINMIRNRRWRPPRKTGVQVLLNRCCSYSYSYRTVFLLHEQRRHPTDRECVR